LAGAGHGLAEFVADPELEELLADLDVAAAPA
jgi:hypothetical protein